MASLRARGLTLIELLVALAIGAFLMLGAVTIFMQGRSTFRTAETVARLQENARFALATIEADVRMAGYFGLTARGFRIRGRAGPADPLGLGPRTCGNNWAIDLAHPIAATNDSFAWACGAASYRPGTDTLVVRRVSGGPVKPAAGGLYVQSARFEPGRIFAGATVPAGYGPDTSRTFELVANGYYVARTSASLGAAGSTVPSLHRVTLLNASTIEDQEILAGVEDLQVELGVDTDAPGSANRGAVDRYVNASDPILDPASAAFDPDAAILAVRIWLRVRSQTSETGFADDATYDYAGRSFTPSAAEQPFRRTLLTKTIYLRNEGSAP